MMPPKRKRVLQPESTSRRQNEDLGTISLTDEESEGDEHESNATVDAGEDDGQGTLLSLDFALTRHSKAIWQLLRDPISDGPPVYHLRDIPHEATWSESNTLCIPGPQSRAVVIVAFGSLASYELVLKHHKPTKLTVIIDLFCAADAERLGRIHNLAQPGGQGAIYQILARRESAGPRSRLLNVYDRSGCKEAQHKVAALSINELVGDDDVVRMEMRCVRIKVGEVYRAEFKLKTLSLYLATSRGVDIMQ
uniref:N/A n=1 Tax=Ganoderma boninense TaxID=34458 RepID=A0A5K1K4G4_9APHY|nr:N/A [Ganoderma boninense]